MTMAIETILDPVLAMPPRPLSRRSGYGFFKERKLQEFWFATQNASAWAQGDESSPPTKKT
jgi:hypothetical protein